MTEPFKPTVEQVKELRDRTNISMMVCKKALEATGGDVEKAIEQLRVAGELRAQDLVNRTATQGGVFSYVHPGNRVGVLVQVACESDFVARGEAFQEFAKDLAMHVAASKPLFIRSADAEGSPWLTQERSLITQAMTADPKMAKKPEAMLAKIADGKLEKRVREVCLLDQPFVREPTKTIEDLRVELVQKTGENIQVIGFSRLDMADIGAAG